nr:NADH dehydrogenase subunit 3 [Monopis longella]
MNLLISISIILIFFSYIMMTLSMILSKKSMYDREKCSPFECGFNPYYSSRMPFSLHFFLIAVIFLIFDIEIALIFPMISTYNITNLNYWMLISLFFFFVLLIGIYHEWNQNMLNWTI